MSMLIRVAGSLAAAVMAAFVAAIVLVIFDLGRTGHGQSSITATIIERQDMGIALSIADIVLLCSSLAAAVLAWIILGLIGPSRTP